MRWCFSFFELEEDALFGMAGLFSLYGHPAPEYRLEWSRLQ